ncbi:MAG: AAA family ATPase, partial [Desulfobacterales bacterium]|nr:AAA family ATPase [Desulfobacterales bacterium]
MELFADPENNTAVESRPLAERMRPRSLQEFVGQSDVAGPGSLLAEAIRNDRIFSMILWGPPGTGKTTLARIVAHTTRSHFVHFSAVLSGVKEIRAVIEEAREMLSRQGKREVISALLSRCRVVTLHQLSDDELRVVLRQSLEDDTRGLGRHRLVLSPAAADHLIQVSGGDARTLLNNLEMASFLTLARQGPPADGLPRPIEVKDVEQALQQKALQYDKGGEEHYNLISAFHKSLRGSDPDAALYWLARMLMAGEDPLFVARRMVRFASEDIGNADPHALPLTMAAMEAFRFIGPPEGELCLAQAAAYLATAVKSNSIYSAYGQVRATVQATGSLPVPLHIR